MPGFLGMGCLALARRVESTGMDVLPSELCLSHPWSPGWECLAQTYLEESLGVEEEGGQDQLLPSPGRDPGQSSVCEGSPKCHRNVCSLVQQTQRETAGRGPRRLDSAPEPSGHGSLLPLDCGCWALRGGMAVGEQLEG